MTTRSLWANGAEALRSDDPFMPLISDVVLAALSLDSPAKLDEAVVRVIAERFVAAVLLPLSTTLRFVVSDWSLPNPRP